MKNEITTVVFDIGMVLAEFAWRDLLAKMNYGPEDVELFAREIFLSSVWDDRDRGCFDEAYYVARFKERVPGREEDVDRIFDRIAECVYEYDFSAQWLRNIKAQGYRVLYLSNYAEKNWKIAADYAFRKEFQGGVVSFEEHLMKPEPEIYRCLMERYDLRPEEFVFLDDRPVNIQGALDAGFLNTICAKDHDTAVRELWERFGIRS